MSGSFTLTGKLTHHDKVTPHIDAPVHIGSVVYADGTDHVVYTQGADVVTDATGAFSVPLLTETDLYYTVQSLSNPPLFDALTFLAPANGTTVDLSTLVTTNPGSITPSLVTQAQAAATSALASAAAAAASAAGIAREANNGVAGLDGTGKLFDIRLPDRLRNVAAREYATITEAGTVPITHPAYGADKTGVVAADTAIAAASTAAAAFGGSVLIPPGTFKISGGVTNNTVGQKWLLAAGATLDGTASTSHPVTLNANGTGVVGPGKINGGTIAFSCVFIAAGLADIKVLGPELVGATYGVRCKGATGAVTTRVQVNGCTIHGQTGALGHGVFFNWETTDSEISCNQIYSTGGNGIWVGNSSFRVKILGNTIVSPGRNGIECFSSATGSTVVGNIIQSSNIGISMDRSDGSRVALNRIETTVLYGLECAASNLCVFEGNVVKNAGDNGMSLSAASGTCDDNEVVNNTFIAPVSNGIYNGGSANGAKRLRVIGNTVIDAGNGAGSVLGIGAVTGIGADSWTIEGNTIRWAQSSASSTGIGPNGSNMTVVGNTIICDAAMTTGIATGINQPASAVGWNISSNTIQGNGKMSNGIVLATTCATTLIATNVITGTTSNILNNNATATTIHIANNIGTRSSGAGFTFGNATVSGNRDTANAFSRFGGGIQLGISATETVGFYGATPIARPTGWASATGTATRSTFATGSVTLATLAEHVKALEDDLIALGLIGT